MRKASPEFPVILMRFDVATSEFPASQALAEPPEQRQSPIRGLGKARFSGRGQTASAVPLRFV